MNLKSGHAPSSVRLPHASNLFSDTAGPIKAKFQMEPQWDGGKKVCSNDPGHVTKISVMPIYGKNPSKIFSSDVTLNIGIQLWGSQALQSLFK